VAPGTGQAGQFSAGLCPVYIPGRRAVCCLSGGVHMPIESTTMLFRFTKTSRWLRHLENCDLEIAASALWHQLPEMRLTDELAQAIEQFLAEPTLDHAVAVVHTQPDLILVFRESGPRGIFTRAYHARPHAPSNN
jgi:hypothetical protein